mgnify:CR=1 FL=1
MHSTKEVREWMFPIQPEPALTQVILLAAHRINQEDHEARQQASEITNVPRKKIADLPIADRRDIARLRDLSDQMYVVRERLGVKYETYNVLDRKRDYVTVVQTTDQQLAARKALQDAYDAISKRREERLKALKAVAVQLASIHVAAIKAKYPADLVAALDEV